MSPSKIATSCLLACLFVSPGAWAAQPALEQTEGPSKGAFLLHEGGNMHADQAAVRERRARAFEIEQREALQELMAAEYAITQKYLARLPAVEREAMQAELAAEHATFQYRYPQAYEKMAGENPHGMHAARPE